MLERIQKEHGHEGEKYYILFLVALTETAFHVWGELMESTERESIIVGPPASGTFCHQWNHSPVVVDHIDMLSMIVLILNLR